MRTCEKALKIILLFTIFFLPSPGCAAGYLTGKVIDLLTGQPIKGAIVTSGHEVVLTDNVFLSFFVKNAPFLSVNATSVPEVITAPLIGSPVKRSMTLPVR